MLSYNGHFPLDSVMKVTPQKENSWSHLKIWADRDKLFVEDYQN